MVKIVRKASLWGLLLGALLSLPAAVMGQGLPTPANFTQFLDVRCYQIPNQPAINVPLRLDHLNPVLVQMGLPFENVVLGAPQDLCVPVQKNGFAPTSDVRPFIQFVDWKCYGITGPALNVRLHLDHLNPVIRSMFGPSDDVIVREPQQLCVPIAKNGQFPPDAVRHLVESLDVKCYRVDATQKVGGNITLTHLNPLFATLPPENTTIVGPTATQLCVPVAKNKVSPPTDVLPIIQFSDVLCYPLIGNPLNAQLRLSHLNPVLIGMHLPDENVLVTNTDKLCVPVAKNGQFPPTGSGTTTSSTKP